VANLGVSNSGALVDNYAPMGLEELDELARYKFRQKSLPLVRTRATDGCSLLSQRS
jgi:hypothetical protein